MSGRSARARRPSGHALPERSPVHRLARRELGGLAVVAQSVGAIAPTAAMVTTPALLVAGAGPGAVWSALVGAVAALLLAGVVNQFARRMAAPGSLYAFAAQGLGPAAAFATGCALLVGYAAIVVASLVGASWYLRSLVAGLGAQGGSSAQGGPSAHGGLGGHGGLSVTGEGITLALTVLVLAAVVAVLVLRGVRVASVVLVAFEAVAIGVVLVTTLQLLGSPGPHLSVAALAPSTVDWRAVAAGVTVATAAFIGFESSTALAPEVRRPLAVVPRALTWTVVGASALLVLGTLAQADAFAHVGVDPGSTPSPLNDLAAAAGVGMPQAVLDVAIGVSFFACATASSTALVRLLFAMGTEGMAPRALGRVHPRFRTPHVAVAASVPLLAAVAGVPLAVGASVRGALDAGVSVSVLGYVLAYLLVCLAAPRFLGRIGERTGRAVAVAVAAAVVLGVTLVTFAVTEAFDAPLVLVAFVVLMGAGAVWFRRTARRRPDRLDAIGVFDATSSDDVLWQLPDVPAGPR